MCWRTAVLLYKQEYSIGGITHFPAEWSKKYSQLLLGSTKQI